MQYPHLEALHDLSSLPYDETIGPRGNKERLLEHYGFAQASHPAEFASFDLSGDGAPSVRSYLDRQIAEGKYSALLFRGGNWESMGGCTVAYLMNETDMAERVSFDAEGRIAGVVVDGESISPEQASRIDVYSRRRSAPATLSGFDNYPDSRQVTVGGGFRLQIDELNYEGGRPYLGLLAALSFDDYGSRVLAMNSEDDRRVPIVSLPLHAAVTPDGLTLPEWSVDQQEIETATDAARLVLSELFRTDGKAIESLASSLLRIRPAMQVHQLEGIYGVSRNGGVSAEVIDFDGLDTYDLNPASHSPTPTERLTGGQLVRSGFLPETDDAARVDYVRQQLALRAEVTRAVQLGDLGENVGGAVRLRAGEDMTAYARRLKTPYRLARTLRYCNVDWTQAEAENVKRAKVRDWVITHVTAAGFDSAFAECNGELAPLQGAKDILALTRQMFGVDMLSLYVTLSKEGD